MNDSFLSLLHATVLPRLPPCCHSTRLPLLGWVSTTLLPPPFFSSGRRHHLLFTFYNLLSRFILDGITDTSPARVGQISRPGRSSFSLLTSFSLFPTLQSDLASVAPTAAWSTDPHTTQATTNNPPRDRARVPRPLTRRERREGGREASGTATAVPQATNVLKRQPEFQRNS